MTLVELKQYILDQLAAPVTVVQKIINVFNAVVDHFTGNTVTSIIPDWAADLTFQTDGTGSGKFCIYADTNGKKRIFETKTDDNINNAPPSNPTTTENTYWLEISQAGSSAIVEWEAKLYGAGLVIVYYNHSTLGRVLCILTEASRPFNSTNIETEITAGKWDFINLPNATETVAGKSEEGNDGEVQAGTAVGGSGARLFVNPAKLATWWTWIKTQAQTFTAALTATDLTATNQAGTDYRFAILDSAGKVVRNGNCEWDDTNKCFILRGINDLESTAVFKIYNSSGELLFEVSNGKFIRTGGDSSFFEVNEGTASGDAGIRFINDQLLGWRLQDSGFNDYIKARSSSGDKAVELTQTVEHNYLQGEKRIEKQFSITTDTVAAKQHVLFEFELADLDHYDIKVLHAEATATDGTSITSLGIDCADCRKVASTNIEGNTSISTQSRLPSTVTDGGFNWNLDTTNQKIQFRFQNVSVTGKTFTPWAHASIVKRLTPVSA